MLQCYLSEISGRQLRVTSDCRLNKAGPFTPASYTDDKAGGSPRGCVWPAPSARLTSPAQTLAGQPAEVRILSNRETSNSTSAPSDKISDTPKQASDLR